jgi:hypothetical protein
MIMENRHTPGLWGFREAYSNGEPCGYVITPQGYDLSTSSEETTRADARLIAASPELLEALQRILKSAEWAAQVIGDIPPHSEYMEGLKEARELIARVKG